jgi:hypothetical protein
MAAKSFGPVGIIDIGSNSVRFVAYGGTARVPSSLFNEKTTAALGRGLSRDGKLDDEAMALTLEALTRFRQLAREMGIRKLHTVATAAVRDASNGPAFLKQIAALGLKPKLLSGGEEAQLSGLGVISGIPRAHGVVADLGEQFLLAVGGGDRLAGDADVFAAELEGHQDAFLSGADTSATSCSRAPATAERFVFTSPSSSPSGSVRWAMARTPKVTLPSVSMARPRITITQIR